MAKKRVKPTGQQIVETLRRLPQAPAAWLLGLTGRTLRDNASAPRNPDGTYNAQALVAWYRDRQPRAQPDDADFEHALVVAEDVRSDDVARTIKETGGSLLVDVVLFDVYRGKQLGAGRKNLAFNLTFQSPDKTLTTEQTAQIRAKIVRRVAEKYQAELRS